MSTLLSRPSFAGTIDFKLSDGVCEANCGLGTDWLTVYLIETPKNNRNKGEAQALLRKLKEYCDSTNRRFGVWHPMNEVVEHICQKMGIKTYESQPDA